MREKTFNKEVSETCYNRRSNSTYLHQATVHITFPVFEVQAQCHMTFTLEGVSRRCS